MCYETSSTKIKEEMESHFQASFEIEHEYTPFFHRSGFSHDNLQIIKMDEPNSIYPASWGLVPDWGLNDFDGFRKKYNTLNTKSETLFSGISKDSARDKRCLILADGFFEPNRQSNISTPHFCYIPTTNYEDGRNLFAFAGIYSEIDHTTNAYTCSIITTSANDFFSEIHNVKKRMPLVLDKDLYKEWFSQRLSDENVLELMKHGFTSEEFNAYPVSRDLYKRGIDTNKEYILNSIPRDTLF